MNLFLNKLFLLTLVVLLAESPAMAAEQLPPLPNAKIPAMMPEQAAWEITYAYTDRPDSESPDRAKSPGDLTQAQVRPRLVTVTRTGDIVREQITWDDSRNTEKWIYRKLLQVLEVEPGGKLVRLPASYLVSEYTDYSKSDFPGFHWIGKETYTSFREIGGRPCFIFTAKAGTAPTRSAQERAMERIGLPEELRGNDEPQYDLIAVIDSETLLPVFLDDGIGRKNFRILPPPSGPLQVPPAFAEEFGDWLGKIQEATRIPGPP